MNNAPWIVGAIGAFGFFVFWEALAFRHPERFNTLSRWIADMGSKFPLSIWIMGGLSWGLAVHFFWHWCPDIGAGIGLLSH